MNQVEYNGWTNYETWCVHLWLTNDQGAYNYWREEAEEYFEQASRANHQTWTSSENARFMLADQLKEELEGEAQDMLTEAKAAASIWADLLGAALSEVNWNEIANAFLEDAEFDGKKYERMKEVQS